MTSRAISIEFQLTLEEARHARQALLMNPPFEPGTWTVVSILASVFIGYIGVALAGHELTSRGVPNYIQWALAVLSATVVFLASLAIRWVSALRPYSETATGQGSTTVHLSETGFSVHGPGQSLSATWASLRRIAETTKFSFCMCPTFGR